MTFTFCIHILLDMKYRPWSLGNLNTLSVRLVQFGTQQFSRRIFFFILATWKNKKDRQRQGSAVCLNYRAKTCGSAISLEDTRARAHGIAILESRSSAQAKPCAQQSSRRHLSIIEYLAIQSVK